MHGAALNAVLVTFSCLGCVCLAVNTSAKHCQGHERALQQGMQAKSRSRASESSEHRLRTQLCSTLHPARLLGLSGLSRHAATPAAAAASAAASSPACIAATTAALGSPILGLTAGFGPPASPAGDPERGSGLPRDGGPACALKRTCRMPSPQSLRPAGFCTHAPWAPIPGRAGSELPAGPRAARRRAAALPRPGGAARRPERAPGAWLSAGTSWARRRRRRRARRAGGPAALAWGSCRAAAPWRRPRPPAPRSALPMVSVLVYVTPENHATV